MVVLRVLAGLTGGLLILSTLLSAVQTVVLPRARTSWVTRRLFLTMRPLFHALANGRHSFEHRDRVMAYYGPIGLVILPGAWVLLVMVGFTGLFWSFGDVTLRDAFLTSGSSILTLGVVFQKPLPHAALTFIEATIGLGLVSLMISYLPTIYGAFSRREQLVGLLEVRAGSPPSPEELLTRYFQIGWLTQIDEDLFPRWEDWFADIEESHTSHPALAFFRSPRPERSWITAAGCVLDSAAIVASALDRPFSPRSAVLIRSGSVSLGWICEYFSLPHNRDPKPDDPISVTRVEFDHACNQLAEAGIAIKADRDQAWKDFAGWRVNYDQAVIGLANLVMAPPARWSSDRTLNQAGPSTR